VLVFIIVFKIPSSNQLCPWLIFVPAVFPVCRRCWQIDKTAVLQYGRPKAERENTRGERQEKRARRGRGQQTRKMGEKKRSVTFIPATRKRHGSGNGMRHALVCVRVCVRGALMVVVFLCRICFVGKTAAKSKREKERGRASTLRAH